MKGGTVEDFVEYLYTCQDTAFIYKAMEQMGFKEGNQIGRASCRERV